MTDVKIRRVANGFIVTVGEGEDGQPAPQFVARHMDELCELLRTMFEPKSGAA